MARVEGGLVNERDLPTLITRLHRDVASGVVEASRAALAEIVSQRAPWLAPGDVVLAVERVLSRVGGLGEIAELLADDSVTDVLVNGPGPVMVERDGSLALTSIVLDGDGVGVLVERLTALGRRRVDRRHPTADVRLPGGFRANIVVAPAAVDGPHVSIRRHRGVDLALDDMAERNVAATLRSLVSERDNVIVCGSTGSGKTTLLGLLLDEVPSAQRIVTIEDVAELVCRRQLVRMEAQPDDGEGSAPIGVRQLFRNSLRMRPDRLVIGEIRGSEAADLLQALGTGHRGSMTTVHADDPASALRRLELLVAGAGISDPELVRAQIRAVVDVVVHVERTPCSARRVAAVARLAPSGLIPLHGDGASW